MKLFFLVLVCICACFGQKVTENTLLNSYPIIMSHDAATGEIDDLRDHIVSDWAKTQEVGLVKQLDCGARSFDYRPFYDGKAIFAHHGGVKIYKPMETSVLEILAWSRQNPEDLIVLYISHFDGQDGAQAATIDLLAKLKVHTITDQSSLKRLTYGAAKKLSTHISGGYLLAVIDCMEENYDDKINCYGKDYACYDSWPNNSSNVPWDRFNAYLEV